MPNAIEQIVFNKLDIPRLRTVLDLAATRQRLLTENVANAETPGYKRKDIDFKAELRSAVDRSGDVAMKATREQHYGATPQTRAPQVNEEDVPEGQNFGVDIDREMSAVAQNQMEYSVAARLVSRKFDALRTVIRGRR
jgi:flagellar basal-body rod protein FlgB